MARMNWRCRVRTVCLSFVSILACLAAPPSRADEPSPRVAQPGAGEPRHEPDAALRGLFGGGRASVDPALEEFEALYAQLAEQPLAPSAGKLGLDRARAELERLRAAIARKADPDGITLQKQRVWAALALADRQIARAALAAASSAAQERLARADERLGEARRAREQVEAELRALREAAGQTPP